MLDEVRRRVERVDGHRHDPVLPCPLLPRPVPVELDPIALRIVQVEGLTDPVVRTAGDAVRTVGQRPCEAGRETGRGIEQECGVEQPGGSRGGGREIGSLLENEQCALPLAQDHPGTGRRAGVERQVGLRGEDAQPDGVRVEVDLPIEVAHPQGHLAEVRCRGQSRVHRPPTGVVGHRPTLPERHVRVDP